MNRYVTIIVCAMLLIGVLGPMQMGAGEQPSGPGPMADPNLVAEWKFDEGAGTIANDTSGKWNNGTLTNMNTGVCWVNGVNGTALKFDGNDDYVSVPDDATLDITDAITIQAWVNYDFTGEQMAIVCKDDNIGNGNYDLYTMGNGVYLFSFHDSIPANQYFSVVAPVPTIVGEWYHIALSHTFGNSASTKFVVNGQIVAGTWGAYNGNAIPISNTVPVTIGKWQHFNTAGDYHNFRGSIDDVQIWNRALTENEISAYYNATWRNYMENESCELELLFDEGTGTMANDTSGNWNNGTLWGPSWTYPGINGTALSFDGNDDYIIVPYGPKLNVNMSMTIEAWVKPTGWDEFDRIIGKADATGTNNVYALGVGSSGGIYYALWKTGAQHYIDSAASLNLNRWNHIAGTWDGSTMRIYLNGVQQPETINVSAPMDTTDKNLFIGMRPDGQQKYEGALDEIRIWARALDSTEILNAYNSLAPVHNIDSDEYFTTIQAAIDDAETLNGHTILCDNGTFVENVIVNKSVAIVGQGPAGTRVDGGDAGNVFDIQADNVTIRNLEITNASYGIFDDTGFDHCIVENCSVNDCALMGINFNSNANFNSVMNCTIFNNQWGVRIQSSSWNNCSWNTMHTNGGNFVISFGTYNDFMHNHIYGNTYPMRLEQSCIGNRIWHNNIHDHASGLGHIGLWDSSQSNLFYYNDFTNNNKGIEFDDTCNSNTVWKNNFTGSGIGVDCINSANNLIYHNNFATNTVHGQEIGGANAWDNGYPSGGNYWSGWTSPDNFGGALQNLPGADGVVDSAYDVSGGS
ncbi:MAG: LamG-like jellyroll fold domain-containing protein, partial [Thermoplasmata archaeon]